MWGNNPFQFQQPWGPFMSMPPSYPQMQQPGVVYVPVRQDSDIDKVLKFADRTAQRAASKKEKEKKEEKKEEKKRSFTWIEVIGILIAFGWIVGPAMRILSNYLFHLEAALTK